MGVTYERREYRCVLLRLGVRDESKSPEQPLLLCGWGLGGGLRHTLNACLHSCLVPRCDGIVPVAIDKEALWDRYFTAAPRPLTPSERQYSDRKPRSRS